MRKKVLTFMAIVALALTALVLAPSSAANGSDVWSIGDREPGAAASDGAGEFGNGISSSTTNYYIGTSTVTTMPKGISYPGGEINIYFSVLNPGEFVFEYGKYGIETDYIYLDGIYHDSAVGLGEGVYSEFAYVLNIGDTDGHTITIEVIDSGDDQHYFDYFKFHPSSPIAANNWEIGDREPDDDYMTGKDEFWDSGTYGGSFDYYLGYTTYQEMPEGIAYPGGEVVIHFAVLIPGTFVFEYGRYGAEVDEIYLDNGIPETVTGLGEGVHSEFTISMYISDQDVHTITIRVTSSPPDSQHYFDYFNFYMMAFEVDIDIKPGSDPNSINLNSQGTVPVAILGTDIFDVTNIDPGTVTLAGASIAMRGKSNKLLASTDDVNGDGYTDLIIHIETEDLGLDEGSTEAVLQGETYNGITVIGSDSINLVPQ